MRTIDEIIKEYSKLCEDTTMCSMPGYENVYMFRNQPKRDELQREYEDLLPENQRMAILLHEKLCKYDHTDQCSWYYEIDGIEHDWNRYQHKEYLEKADKLISKGINIDIMKIVFECI